MLPRITETDIEAFDLEFNRDVQAFAEHLPEMLTQYPGEFVAIYQGQIIEHQKDWETLAKAMQIRFPNRFVFLKQVISESTSAVCMETVEG